MHTVVQSSEAPAGETPGDMVTARARVAVAGATGFTGQELLRLLSRHPAVTLTAAMSSGQTGASSRRLPALGRLWSGTIVPLSPAALASDADVVFLALPDSAAAEIAPALVDAGVRVIDLSGAFGCATRPRAASGIRTRIACRRASPTASPNGSAARSRAPNWSPTRAVTRPRRCW